MREVSCLVDGSWPRLTRVEQDGSKLEADTVNAVAGVSAGVAHDEDVLAGVPLPGYLIFDAVFGSWNDHREAATSGGATTDTPVARIQRTRRRAVICIACLVLLSAVSRLLRTSPAGSARLDHASREDLRAPHKDTAAASGRSFLRWRNLGFGSSSKHSNSRLASTSAHSPLPPSYYASFYNASHPPARLRPSDVRMAMLEAIAKSRTSTFKPEDFIINHRGVMDHHRSGGDTIELIQRKPDPDEPRPSLRLHATSAIIVHSPDYDVSSTQVIVSMVAKYPFVREIIVWNNDLGLYINEHTLNLPDTSELGFLPPSLRILNAPTSFSPLSSPIHRRLPAARAKHLACGLAMKSVCLFLSPALLPIHLDSLYSAYLATGPVYSQIVGIVNAGDYYQLERLKFENEDVDLHTGVVMPGLQTNHAITRLAEAQETIVRRDWSRRFVQQLATLTPDTYGDEADAYWSIWMNTHPKLLTAPALAMHDDQAPLPVQLPAARLQDARDYAILDAIRNLYTTLKAQDPFLSPDPFPIAPSPDLDTARAPCHDDKCTFVTNITPFRQSLAALPLNSPSTPKRKAQVGQPQIPINEDSKVEGNKPARASKLAFDPFVHIRSVEEYEAAWTQTSDGEPSNAFPANIVDFQRSSNWYLAVNGRHPSIKTQTNNSTSCWTSPAGIARNDYFGLAFHAPQSVTSIKIFGSRNLGNIVGKGEEDLTAESWEIWTAEAIDAKAEWTRRSIEALPVSTAIGDSGLYVHSFELSSSTGYVQAESNNKQETHDGRPAQAESEDDLDDQVLRKRALPDEILPDDAVVRERTEVNTPLVPLFNEVQAIRFVSRDSKGQALRLCGFDIDGWTV